MKKRILLLGVCVVIGGIAGPVRADVTLAQATARAVAPTHLRVGNQQFAATVGGLRDYLDSTKLTDPNLNAALTPDVERLEAQQAKAVTVLAVGAAVGVVATIIAVAGRSDCPMPDVTAADFAARSAAWGDCNDQNMRHTMLFGSLGLGALAAGAITAAVMAPKRSDVMDVMNKHNRLSPEPMQLQLGYNPTNHHAYASASVAF
ncbi:MAG: hypothetical protein ABJA82_12545 [Myxococcales bacterium]